MLFQDFYILFLELDREGLSDSQFADYWRSVEARFQRCSSSVASSGFSSDPLVVPLVVGSVPAGPDVTPETMQGVSAVTLLQQTSSPT